MKLQFILMSIAFGIIAGGIFGLCWAATDTFIRRRFSPTLYPIVGLLSMLITGQIARVLVDGIERLRLTAGIPLQENIVAITGLATFLIFLAHYFRNRDKPPDERKRNRKKRQAWSPLWMRKTQEAKGDVA